jgi:hypothetical protein
MIKATLVLYGSTEPKDFYKIQKWRLTVCHRAPELSNRLKT